ncbi:ATP-binding cassette, subfamily C [Actinacidiphila alni]|uniref:ATP-binding cassette, subfamily C n=1 Tax=Actinacidiphila alni TaxID=380248 RepID=A0A1I2KIZ2_9ACTN|nr:ABC transporter ATP-binding protein [Actinacidiphila alni]SFF66308.1 ATP-binding cassette, subfamily C [Actinacidiphila alni]
MPHIVKRDPGLRLLREATAGSRRPLVRALGWSAVQAAPALASGRMLATALDRGFLAGRPATGLLWLAGIAALYGVRAAAQRAVFDPLAAIVEPMRDALVRRVVRGALGRAVHEGLPGAGPDAAGVTRLSSQVDAVRGTTAALLRTALPLAVNLLAALIGLASLDLRMAVVVAVPLLAAIAVFVPAMRALTRRRAAFLLAEERVAAATGSVVAAARDVAALGARDAALAEVRVAAEDSARAATTVAWANALRVPVILVGGQLPVLGLLLAGPSLVHRGEVSAGAVIGAVSYVTAFLIPALQQMTGSVAGFWSQLRVLTARLAATSAGPGPSGPAAGRRPLGAAELAVHGLTFAYGPHSAPVLRDVSFTVPVSGHLVLVGPSGVGKSTLAGLLAGIGRPDAGRVELGGRPVAGLPEAVRAASIALVPQEAYVFPGTLRENVAYLAPDATDAALNRAVAAVGMRPLLDRLGGYDADLTDPAGTLSSGERQLIALARVYASAARLVILDEATCHLDPAAEAVVESAFARRPGTLVVVAHRLSSAARAEHVLILDAEGHAFGSHGELLATHPGYAALVGHWDAPLPAPVP